MERAKSFCISKEVVWEAYTRVKANQGAAGVDGESISEFEGKLKDNLYKLWNRMSSGTYFPPAVRTVAIPKDHGGERVLGIPTVGDRIAQTVVKACLEPLVEPVFHPDSYGYRPGKSATDAVGTARQRCWRYDWVLDLDIKGFFDHIDHDLMMRAVRKHTDCKWMLLYIERWLKAPAQQADGTLTARDEGTPQGGVISPLLANIFLHHAFDEWMRTSFPQTPFERYADDIIVHCKTEAEALLMKRRVGERLALCKLELHPEKTKVVYCKDADRGGRYPNEKFDFLGFEFRPRLSKNRYGKCFVSFSPAVSTKAAHSIRQTITDWGVARRSDKSLEDLSRMFNPIVRGWINYYGRFYKSALYPILRQLDRALVGWVQRKYKRFRHHVRRATRWLGLIARKERSLFAHWQLGVRPAAE